MLRGVARVPFRRLCTQAAPPGNGPNHRTLLALDGNTIRPFVQPNAFVAPSASVIGSVIVNDKSAVWYGAVVRGDLALIHIGAHVMIGDNTTLHAGEVDSDFSPADAVSTGLAVEPELVVGDYSTVGANATLRGCMLEGDNVVGHGATVGQGVKMGRYAQVLPASWVEGVEIGEGEIWAGRPARKVGEVPDEERLVRRQQAELSDRLVNMHAYEFLPYGFGYLEKERLEQNQVQHK